MKTTSQLHTFKYRNSLYRESIVQYYCRFIDSHCRN